MDPAAPVIKQMTQDIEKNMQELSDKLDKKYGTFLQRVDSKRFDLFQRCLKEKGDIAECYEKTDNYHVNIEFGKANKQFQDCIQTVTNDYFDQKIKKDQNFIERNVKACTSKYELVVVTEMEKQIKKLNKLL